uniref:hypothetical protein n=1 Tax=Enterobacter sp. TaxID=42895 RepID=UPI00296F6F33|nr:hypothetical protein [Enterobacter sp.]
MKTEKFLMNTCTGSVDTEENWLAEMLTWEVNQEGLSPQDQFDTLIEVIKTEDGWVEV